MIVEDVLAKYGIPRELLDTAGVRRATDCEVRGLLGINGRNGQDLSGIVFPYRDPRAGHVVSHRVRLDVPLDGQKYLSAQGCRTLFFSPIRGEELTDTSIPVVIVEAEKSALALTALASRHARKLLVVAAGGAWGWKRKIGSELQADGTREPVTGPSPSLDWIVWKGRKAILALDSNVASRRDLQKARLALAEELSKRGAQVFVASVPRRQGVNGPDDLIAVAGDGAALEMLDRAGPFAPLKQQEEKLGSGVVLRCVSDIEREELRWVWPGRIPLGKLTLFAGDPGLGKSLATQDIAARVTRGHVWPDGAAGCQAGSVIILSAEDDAADTIRPRLDAAGADLRKVHILQAVRRAKPNGETSLDYFSLETDLIALQDAVASVGDVRLIAIDPISAYLGATDSHKNAKVRGLLAPLAGLASSLRLAVIAVDHLSKSNAPAIYRPNGSIAFTAAARAVWLFAKSSGDPAQRLMLPGKMNLAPEQTGMGYRVEGKQDVAVIAWGESVSVPVDAVLESEGAAQRSERLEAMDWLRDQLTNGPIAQRKLKDDAKAERFSWATVRRAKDALGVITEKSGYQGAWQWRLKDTQSKDAQPYTAQLSTFEPHAENTKLNSKAAPKDAHPTNLSTFDAFEDDGEVTL
jgi:hypothetical protein